MSPTESRESDVGKRNQRRSRPEPPGPSGFVIVDKPAGQTSHDVVDSARRWFGTRRVGHLGTLDPQATGVLPLAIRGATKLIPFIEGGTKIYDGTVVLGVETDTLDREGEVLGRRHHLVEDAVDAVAHLELVLEGLEVDIGGLVLDGLEQDEVEQADDLVVLRRGGELLEVDRLAASLE